MSARAMRRAAARRTARAVVAGAARCTRCGEPATRLVPMRRVHVELDAETGAERGRGEGGRYSAPMCDGCGPPRASPVVSPAKG